MGELKIHPLTAERFPDLAALFTQGGDPKWCWCSFYRVRSVDFRSATPAANRRVLEGALAELAPERRAPGLVAYRDGEAVGWVSLGPRDDYDRLRHSKILAPVDDGPSGRSCASWLPERRAAKVSRQALLEAAVEYARKHGATLLEAYPIDADGGRVPAATAYKGTVTMFERAGFKVVERRRANGSSTPRPIVRRAIRSRRRA